MDRRAAQVDIMREVQEALNCTALSDAAKHSVTVATDMSHEMEISFVADLAHWINRCVDAIHGEIAGLRVEAPVASAMERAVAEGVARGLARVLEREIPAALGVHLRVGHNP